MGPSGHFHSGMGLVIRDVYIFSKLTGIQRTPRFWGVTESMPTDYYLRRVTDLPRKRSKTNTHTKIRI